MDGGLIHNNNYRNLTFSKGRERNDLEPSPLNQKTTLSINLLNSLGLDPEQWTTYHQRLKAASSLSALVWVAFQMGLWVARCLVEQELEHRAQAPTEWPACPHCGRPLHSKGFQPRQILTEIWSEVLQVEPIGIYDNFLTLGGDSILAIQVANQIGDVWQVELEFIIFFQEPTIAKMAVKVTQERAEYLDAEDMSELLGELESLSEEEVQKLLTESQ